ncbi:HAD family hydrolase [Fundidesulfovibrio agrisoli]|uniref:HAD family hydrolase n=1 Tax=Fundidesulfovibrio agrisoli TaxID=2922717 RepID=UPI001FAE3BE2|nr:HAD family hydrolase [Fundidesulfovibrio agrisoli]
MSVRAVVFDLDGTLIDSLEDLADASNAALETMGLPAHPLESYKIFVGDGIRTMMQRALPQEALHRLDEAVEHMRREYDRNWKEKSRPYPGIPELLDKLTARGLPLAVLSNKPDDFTRLVVRDLLGRWSWSVVLGEGEYPKKPDPAGALALAARLGLDTADMVLVGDTPMDVLCAKNSGMACVGVTWGFRPRADLEAAGQRVFIDHPVELLQHI